MIRNSDSSIPRGIALVCLLGLPIQQLAAQDSAVGFADDFSVNSIRYSVDSFDDGSGIASADYAEDKIRISTSGNEDGFGNINVRTFTDTSFYSADVTLSSETSLLEQEEFSAANLYVEAYLYNDTYETAPEQYSQEGDVWVTSNFGVDQFGNTSAFYCLRRVNDEGQWVDLGEFGTELCNTIPGSEALEVDVRYTMSLNLNRDDSTVTISIGELVKEIALTGNVFPPLTKEQRIQLYQDGAPGTAVAYLHRVESSRFTDDFAEFEPILGRYTNVRNDAVISSTIENEQLKLSAMASSDDSNDNAITVLDNSDYLEALITLLPSSSVGDNDGRIIAYVESNLYNDTADGGFDGRTGDVRAQIAAIQRSDGRSYIEYCLQRADDADFDSRSGLLEDGENCQNFPIALTLNTPYRVSIALDRLTPSVTFRVDEFNITVPIDTAVFDPSRSEKRLESGARNNSTADAYFDNVRTSAAALTVSELASGATEAPAFPEAVSVESVSVASNIAYPFDFLDYSPKLDFVDDFSGVSTDFGFSTGRDRGEAGVSWQDGAVVLETNSFPDNDDGNWTEFYLNQPTDRLEAVVSLSSEFRLPPINDAESQIQIRAVFFNDTQDFGFNDQEGDMEAVISLRVQGDGRRRLRIDLRRRDESGSTGDDLLDSDNEAVRAIESILPALDQQYRIALYLDRENSVLRFEVDDLSYEYPVATPFQPARLRTLVSVNHRGSSGVAVGKVHAIKTDAVDQNFSLIPPTFAPYYPQWNTQRPGRDISVVDERVRFEADGNTTSGRDPGIETIAASDYVGATIELSSESVIAAEGRVHVEVHGILYNDLPDGAVDDSNEGRVFTTVRLTAEGDGARYVQYCAYRSNDANFDDTSELFGGDPDKCPRFDITPELDTAYQAFVSLNREAATLTVGFNGETKVYNIPTSINNTRPFNGVRARTSDGSTVVAYADDLAFAENPVPLEDSSTALVQDVSEASDTGISSGTSSGGSGGCTIGTGRTGDPLLILLLLFSVAGVAARHRRRKYDA